MNYADTVEIPVATLRFLCDLSEYAIADTNDADVHMACIHVYDDEAVMDEVIEARGAVLCASKNVVRIQEALSAYIPEDES